MIVQDSRLAGIGWMLLTTLCFVAVTGIVRHVGSDVAAPEAAFLRYLFGVILFIPFLGRVFKHRPSSEAMKIHLLRGFFHAIGVMLWFYAMARIPIAQVTALGYVTPIFVTVGAAIFFREKLYARRILAILAGFTGAMLVLRPGFAEISAGQIAQLCAAPVFAISYLTAKRLTDTEDPLVIVIMLSLICTVMMAPVAYLNWTTPEPRDLFWFAMTAVFATAGHYTMTRAFRAAPLTVTQPVTFLQLVWATIVGVTMFGEPVDPFVIIGGGIIIAAATFISHREAIIQRQSVNTATDVPR